MEERHTESIPDTEVEILDRAVEHKRRRFVWSGLVTIAIGCLLIVIGLLLQTDAYAAKDLLLGFGAIIVIIGLIRIGIGIINPTVPSPPRSQYSQHPQSEEQQEEDILDTLQEP